MKLKCSATQDLFNLVRSTCYKTTEDIGKKIKSQHFSDLIIFQQTSVLNALLKISRHVFQNKIGQSLFRNIYKSPLKSIFNHGSNFNEISTHKIKQVNRSFYFFPGIQCNLMSGNHKQGGQELDQVSQQSTGEPGSSLGGSDPVGDTVFPGLPLPHFDSGASTNNETVFPDMFNNGQDQLTSSAKTNVKVIKTF